MSVEIQYWHIFLIICCMSETKQNGGNKVEPHGDMKNDPLEEAIISARLMQELHKGPDDEHVRENNIHGKVEKDGDAESAADSGE